MMNPLIAVFITVFLAELGDKTQLATVLFAADNPTSRIGVFFAASAALVTSTALAVLAGGLAERFLSTFPLKLAAGAGFLIIGVSMIAEHFIAKG